MAAPIYQEKALKALKFNALVAAGLGFTASVLLFTGKLPFPNKVAWFSLFSSLCYTAYFLLFDRVIRRSYRVSGILLSQIGSIIISVSIYYSGGLISPLPFLYMAILVSEAIYGLENSFTVPVSAVGYLIVLWGIYFGIFPNPTPWAAVAYERPAFLLIVSALLVSYLALTKNLSEQIIRNLHSAIDRESSEKDAMLKKFSELDASAQIGALAHRIAHDLRAPLSSISGYVQMELLRARTPEAKAPLEDLDQTVNAMAESLVHITAFGKKTGMPAERIQLTEFFRQLLAIAGFSPLARGVKFVKDFPDDMAAVVSASRPDLQQAYFNLVKNALEATQDNAGARIVRVSMRREEKDLVVTVADNGPGMPPGVLKNLFRKSITTKAGGTGVGLVITRDLLTRNDGCIEFHNLPEGGLAAVTRLSAIS